MSCCTTSSEGTKAVISFHENVTIEHAGELQKTFLELLEAHDTVELETEKIEQVDISFLQLLLSLAVSLDRAGKTLLFSGDSCTPALRFAAAASGFFRYVSNDESHSSQRLLHQCVYGEESEG